MNAALAPRNGASRTTASDGRAEVRRWRVPLLAVIAGLVFCAFATSASASFLYYRSGGGTEDLVYAGLTNGERNVVTEQLSNGQFLYTEPAARRSAGGLTSVSRSRRSRSPVSTRGHPRRPLTTLSFEMHNNDDSVDARTSLPTTIEGGAGADDLKGGSGADLIQGDGDVDPDPDGDDTIDGRGGADSMYGDDGNDTVTYASRTPSVFVSIDGVANDGGGGEGDNVQPTVENSSAASPPTSSPATAPRTCSPAASAATISTASAATTAQRRHRQRSARRRVPGSTACRGWTARTCSPAGSTTTGCSAVRTRTGPSAAAAPTTCRAATAATTSTTRRSRRHSR